jgi:hypothetical protein
MSKITSKLITTSFISVCVSSFLQGIDLMHFARIAQKYNSKVLSPNTSMRMNFDCADADLEYISTVRDLEELTVPNTEFITSKGLLHISKLINLRKLVLEGERHCERSEWIIFNKFGGLEHLSSSPKLTTLIVTNCCLFQTHFENMPSLTQLNLDFCRINLSLFSSIACCSKLELLSLSLLDEIPEEDMVQMYSFLPSLKKLTSLSTSDDFTDKIIKEYLVPLPNLTYLESHTF